MRKTENQKSAGSKYTPYEEKNMILRDHLAYDRTELALERTMLAYLRTVFLLLTTGITVIKLLGNDPFFLILGITLLPAAILIFAFGVRRFFLFRESLTKLYGTERGEKKKTHHGY